jgi:NAD(P)-dependent dehydrogenase (short-subunit alcohol dehydrogenase family)
MPFLPARGVLEARDYYNSLTPYPVACQARRKAPERKDSIMEVELVGRIARIDGPPSALNDAIAAALTANGAAIAGAGERPDILVLLSPTAAEAAALAMPNGGRIVMVTSALGLVPARGEAEASLAASAIAHLTRTLAMQLAGDGVLVNAVAVGALAGDRLAERLSSHAQFGPATVNDVARAVLFLVDPASSYVTGHVLTVDGGYTAGYARDF